MSADLNRKPTLSTDLRRYVERLREHGPIDTSPDEVCDALEAILTEHEDERAPKHIVVLLGLDYDTPPTARQTQSDLEAIRRAAERYTSAQQAVVHVGFPLRGRL